uniref:Uncharacterized protein n=1 Tax=Oryza punctata TaxID=4537 RepID=A0A0E0KE77_ORYPU
MGLPLEQWCGGEAAGGGGAVVDAAEKEASSAAAAAGCRTAAGGGGGQGRAAAVADCPGAPRKRRAAPGLVSQLQEQHRQRRDFYSGPDVDAFFAAHNL